MASAFGFLSVLIFSLSASAEVKEIATSDTSSVQVWTAQPTSPKALLLLFPGGKGNLENSNNSLTNNFLVRTRGEFVSRDYSVVIVGTSSWAGGGYSDEDRKSALHLRDLSILITKLNPMRLPVFLIGTSRGTISAGNAALKNKLPDIKGLILTSTVVRNPAFKSLDLRACVVPTLLVHHVGDECRSSPFAEALSLWKKLDHEIYEQFFPVNGGLSLSKDPCAAKTLHGFWKSEGQALDAMNSWIASHLK